MGKFGKHCRSEPLRRQLKALQTAAETSASDVCAQRESLTEIPSWKRFLMFEGKTALAKMRADMLQRRSSEEKARVEAELREASQPAVKGKKEREDQIVEKSKRAKKREKQKEKRKAEQDSRQQAEKHDAPVSLSKTKDDTAEEMDFSSGED